MVSINPDEGVLRLEDTWEVVLLMLSTVYAAAISTGTGRMVKILNNNGSSVISTALTAPAVQRDGVEDK